MSNSNSPGPFGRLIVGSMRLKTGWGRPVRRLGLVGVSMLVLLRVCIGFHFYTEGLDKTSGNFDAGRFFANARGPFAEQFRQQIWDWDGNVRLDQDRTFRWWDGYTIKSINYFAFDKKQQRAAKESNLRARAQLEWILKSNENEIEEFELGKSRLSSLNEEVMRDGVASLGGQRDTIRKDWQRLIAPVFVQVDKAWTNLESEINGIADDQQFAAKGVYKLGKPRDVMVDTSVINPLIPYFDLTIGVCLILGLGVPVVGLAAAIFLGSVFMSQFPPEPGPGSTYYQLVEGAACLVLAGTGAGRFAGLDFIFYAIGQRFWPSNSER